MTSLDLDAVQIRHGQIASLRRSGLAQITYLDCDVERQEAYFDQLASMLQKHGSGNGITTPSLFRRGCRGGKSDSGGSAKTAHVATFAKSADPESRGRGRRATVDASCSRHRTDSVGPSVSRSRPRGAIAG